MLAPSGAPERRDVRQKPGVGQARPFAGVEPIAATARAALEKIRIVIGDARPAQETVPFGTWPRAVILLERMWRMKIVLFQQLDDAGLVESQRWHPKPCALRAAQHNRALDQRQRIGTTFGTALVHASPLRRALHASGERS